MVGLILVTGAAGKTGQAVIRQLVSRRLPVRALVYRADQLALYEHTGGVQTMVGALEDSAAMALAMGGVRSVYLICPNMHPDESSLAASAIELARSSGVERFVYHSVLLPAVAEMPHHWQKHLAEGALIASNLDYTILQPCAYMQNLLSQWPKIVRDHEFEVPYSLAARMTVVDLEDVAEAAATVLSTDGHSGATYELCGPEALSQHDVAEVLAHQLGVPIRARQLSPGEWERSASRGLSDYARRTLLGMFNYYDQHDFSTSSRALERLLGRPPATFADVARRIQLSAESPAGPN